MILEMGEINIKHLSKNFNVTTRTINNDLKHINKFTRKFFNFSLDLIEVNIKSNIELYPNIYMIYSDLDFNNYTLNKEERLLIEYLILSTSNDFITYTDISETMLVSRSTVVEDQEELNELLQKFNIELNTKTGYGIKLLGEELKIRKILTIIITEYIYLIYIFFNCNYFNDCLNRMSLNDNLKVIDNTIGEVEYKNSIIFDDFSFIELRYYLEYSLIRQKLGFYLNYINSHDSSNIIGYQIYDMLIESLDFNYNNNEKVFVSNFVSYLGFKNIDLNDNVDLSTQFLTRKLIEKLSYLLKMPLHLDYKLFESLSMHLDRINTKPIYKINNYNINLNDYFYDNNYVDKVFEATKNSIFILEDFFKRKISDSEITFIVIYVCASIERIKFQKARELSVLVICNYGIGTSELIKLQLEERFSFKNILVTSSHQLNRMETKEIDLILSTIILDKKNISYLKVSPVLNSKDFEKISNEILKKINYIKNNSNSPHFNNKSGDKKIEKGIDKYLTKKYIRIEEKASSWKESVEMASESLLESGCITEKYVDRMIQNILTNGPYVVINKGFALPHADNSDVVSKTSFSFLKLKNPVTYNAGELDPVKYVCILAANKNEDHTKALFELVNLFQIENFNNELEAADTAKQIEKIIFKYSKFSYEYE